MLLNPLLLEVYLYLTGFRGPCAEGDIPSVTSGQSFQVSVSGAAGYTPREVYVRPSVGESVRDSEAPFNVTLTVPADYAGLMRLNIAAVDGAQRLCYATETDVRVTPASAIIGLTVQAQPVMLSYNAPRRSLHVSGTYADGIKRNVSSRYAGTTYASSNPAIADVNEDGVVTAHSVGRAIITASNGGFSATTDAWVSSVKGDGNQDGIVDATDQAAFVAGFTGPNAGAGYQPPALEAAEAFDFDGDGDVDCDDWQGFTLRWTSMDLLPDSVTVCPCPAFVRTPVPATVGVGQTVEFSTVAVGSGTLTYRWRRNGVELTDGAGVSGASTNVLRLGPVTWAASGMYDVVVTNPCGSLTSPPAELSFTFSPVDAIRALQIAGGVAIATSDDLTRLDVAANGGANGRVDLLDAAMLLRRSMGL